ncbi:alpha/beta fold hydrolase [Amycolatopsis sp. WGS_07]|uniref:alpha/beta fold hydrolase n=1 Tax=Amycolatopsis sp. WGS_07 TaxID=3076764 RepID=UPI0038735A65
MSAAVLAATMVPAALGFPAAQAEPGSVDQIQWKKCPDEFFTEAGIAKADKPRFSCATYAVPISHDDPTQGSLNIALSKKAAGKPSAKVGSIFVNPGGPGVSGWTFSATSGLTTGVEDRFDIIGFDPRGVGRSNPFGCFTTDAEAHDAWSKISARPKTKDEINTTLTGYADIARSCKTHSGLLLDHMATRDVARDLDLLRAAAGEEKLDYVGYSYGTLIGATYANMFPRSVRSMVLDGNVDPALRTTNGVEYDRQRAEGAQISVDKALDRCAKVGVRCEFGKGDPKAKFDRITRRLSSGPITMASGEVVTEEEFGRAVGLALRSGDRAGLWADLQDIFEAVAGPVRERKPQPLRVVTKIAGDPRFEMSPEASDAENSHESFFAVNCADKPFRNKQRDVPAMAAKWERQYPERGRAQAFSESAACPVWPDKSDPYQGPWRADTDNPIVVVGNYFDPNTRYEFSRRMAQELGFSRLISTDADKHCILGDIPELDKVVESYLVDLKTPAAGLFFEYDD